MMMKRQYWLTAGLSFLLAIAPSLLSVPGISATAWGVEFPDGTVAFTSPPRLADFRASQNLTAARNATYYFTITLPAEAEEPLETLEITLVAGNPQRLRYHLGETAAFAGTYTERGEAIPVETTTYDPEQQKLTVTLAQPAAPGQDITVALRPVQNPPWSGVYLFELEAIPVGEFTRSQRVGTARLHIYSRDRRPFSLP